MRINNLDLFMRLLKKTFTNKNAAFDIGLIVKEPQSVIDSNMVLEEIKKEVNIEKLIYDEHISDEDAINKMVEIFTKGHWLLLEIRKDISSPLLNQLKNLANHNLLQLLNYKGQDVCEIKMPVASRLVVFAERTFIETNISYPHFYKLFGPVLSLQ